MSIKQDIVNNYNNIIKLEEIKINSNESDKYTIPKIIHQIWIGPNKMPSMWMNTLKNEYIAKYPEWEYKLWTEKELNELNMINNIQYLKEQTFYGKSNIARYEILYQYGGIYIDSDSVWVNEKSFDDLLEKSSDKGLFFSWENQKEELISVGVIGAAKNHPLTLKIITLIKDRCINNPSNQPVYNSGQYLITALYKENPNSLHIYPSIYFNPLYHNELKIGNVKDIQIHKKIDISNETYLFQYWYSTLNLANMVNLYMDNNNTTPLVSIVMSYINRKEQLLFSLKTISETSYKNIEVVIVDDGSSDEHRLEDIIKNYWFKIKLIRIDPICKNYNSPCIPYNIGFKIASGDIIVIQNPEVCHVGDCIKSIIENIKDDEYMTFNCYGMNNFDENRKLINEYNNSADKIMDVNNLISIMDQSFGGSVSLREQPGGWLNHHSKHYTAYHYLAALTTDTLNKIGGGFCELYKNGICLEDIDFIKTLIYYKITFDIHEFGNNNPFCIHQYHVSPYPIPYDKRIDLLNINLQVFSKRMSSIGMGTNQDIHSNFKMPDPQLINPIKKIESSHEQLANMNLNNIPKIMHSYYQYDDFSLLNFITYYSFKHHNPDWKIKLYIGNNNLSKNKYIIYLTIKNIIEVQLVDFNNINFTNNASNVQKKDYISYYILGTEGGVWMDSDIMTLKPIKDISIRQNLIIGDPNNIDTVIAYDNNMFYIALMMSKEKNSFFKHLADLALEYVNIRHFQHLGNNYIKELYTDLNNLKQKKQELNIFNMPIEYYLPIGSDQLNNFFHTNYKLNNNSFGIYLYQFSQIYREYSEKLNNNLIKTGSMLEHVTKYSDSARATYSDIKLTIDTKINKIIIFGANGMLGNYIKKYFTKKRTYEIVTINRDKYDVMKNTIQDLHKILLDNKIDDNTLIFNAIGMIPHASKNYEVSNEMYSKINISFPASLSTICEKYGAKMIHPTTDCVFSGTKGNYSEKDIHDTTTIYGKTKSRGEQINCTIIRTSIIGEEINNKRSLLEWVKSNKEGEINGYVNHYWNGITCLQFAKVVDKIISENLYWKGVQHIYSPNTVSKYELIKMISEIYNLDIKIKEHSTEEKCDMRISSIYETNKILNIPDLREQIIELKNNSTIYSKSYSLDNLKNIPKILYLYWDGGNKLSFLQYLTVKTFRELNSDWEIIIYTPEVRFDSITWAQAEQKTPYDGRDYYDRLKEHNVTFKTIDFEKIGFKNEISEVIKSDYLRYYLLGNFGGCWADFDIVFIKSMKEIDISEYEIHGNYDDIDTILPFFDNHYPIGFLMSSKNNPIFLNILNNCMPNYDLNSYQSIGYVLIRKLYNDLQVMKNKHPEINILNIPGSSYLPYASSIMDAIFYRDLPDKVNNDTLGIHWFNGSPIAKNFQNQLDKDIHPKTGSLYKYIEKYLYLK